MTRVLPLGPFQFEHLTLEWLPSLVMPVETEITQSTYVPVKAPRGTQISCKGWQQEAAHAHADEQPRPGGRPSGRATWWSTAAPGKAARNWECFHAIVRALQGAGERRDAAGAVGQAGGRVPTHEYAPRVLIANSNLVGHWSNWEKFRELERAGPDDVRPDDGGILDLHRLAGNYAGHVRDVRGGGARSISAAIWQGKLIVTGGMGGMGGAQPLAATMNGAAFLGVEVDPERIKKRLKTGYCDFMVTALDEALRILKNAVRKRENRVGRAGGQLRRHHSRAGRARRGARHADRPDLGARSAERLHAAGADAGAGGASCASAIRTGYLERSLDSIARHVEGMLALQKMGAVTFDYGNNIRTLAFERGVKNAYDFPGFVPAYIRPLFCEGRGPFRWVALSGEPADIHAPTSWCWNCFPTTDILARWIELARKRIKFQGLPARICWLGYGERAQFGLAINELVEAGKIKAPIVIGRDHLDCRLGGLAVSARPKA